jgi:hypothetical protein
MYAEGHAMIFGMTPYTFMHVVISLVGIGSGIVVMVGLLTGRRLDGWTALFLLTTAATSLTGFGLPFDHLLPSHIVGIISLVALAVAAAARYVFHLPGSWQWVYVAGVVISLYFNVFVLIVQLFQKVPALHAMAPTQAEPPFAIVQAAVLVLFVGLGIMAAIKAQPPAMA